MPHVLASVGGLPLYRGRNVLDELVRRAFALVVERDLLAHPKPGGTVSRNQHQTRYLVEGLQRLIASDSAWRPNQEKSRVWYGQDGLFLVWPGAANDLHQLLEGEQIAGMPGAPETMLARLRESDLIEPLADDAPIWQIRPPNTSTALAAIKLASPTLLLSALDPPPAPWPEPLIPATNSPLKTAPISTATAQQLPLIVPGAAPPTSPPPDAPPRWQLKAPLRLNAGVRHALASILAEPSTGLACLPNDQGLFVPLHLFDAHRIAPTLAIRALAEVGMLHVDSADAPATTQRRNAAGNKVTGIRLKQRFVEPLDAAAALQLVGQAAC